MIHDTCATAALRCLQAAAVTAIAIEQLLPYLCCCLCHLTPDPALVTAVLHCLQAAAVGALDIVQLLLKHGADIQCSDSHRFTALHHACRSGHVDVAHLLIRRGADLKASTVDGETPLVGLQLQSYTVLLAPACKSM